MLIQWEIPTTTIESNFRFEHRLEEDVRVVDVEYDPSAEVVVLTLDVDPEDIERIPESDATGTMIFS